MKILDRYILFSFIKSFLSIFIILTFIFIFYAIWMLFSDLAGKDLDLIIFGQLIVYFLPSLLPLILPLSVLLSSINVFGAFAENYEFAAMKSSGISLQRAMLSTTFFIFILSGVTFYIANNLIPWSEYKQRNMRLNISKVKPAMAIVEGQFSDIGESFNIKVAKKSGEKGEFLKDVIIHKKNPKLRGNFTVIKSETGELISSEESNILSLKLNNGNYYDEVEPRDKIKVPFARSYFDTYTINIDLAEMNQVDLEEERLQGHYKMLNIDDLQYYIDSLSESYNKERRFWLENQQQRLLSAITPTSGSLTAIQSKPVDTTKQNAPTPQTKNLSDNFLEQFNPAKQLQIAQTAVSDLNRNMSSIKVKAATFEISAKGLNKYEIAIHHKFALAVSCIVLFFVGAPLGAIIRKGGMGLPLVFAIILFLSYHFIGMMASNAAEENKLPVWFGGWLSTLVMLPLGISFTLRATADKGVFNPNEFIERIKSVFKFIPVVFAKKGKKS